MTPISDATSRLELRRRDDRRRRWRRRLIAAAVVALVLVGGYIVGFSPVLAAHSVEVKGAKVLTKAEVLDAV